MSDEVDDLDKLLRRAMATLDHQIPEGTFDTLAERTLARLDDRGPSLRDDPAFVEPLGEAQDGFDELARARAMRESRAAHASQAGASEAVLAAVPAAAAHAAPLPGSRGRSNRRPIAAVIGLGLAAAAGATIFLSTQDKAQVAPEMAVMAERERDRASAAGDQAVAVGTAAAPEPTGAAPGAGSAAQGDPGDAVQVAKIAAEVAPGVAKPAPAAPIEQQVPMTKGGAKAVSAYAPKKRKGGTGKDDFYGADGATSPEGKAELGKLRVDTGGASSRGQGAGGTSPKLDKLTSDRTSLSTADFQRGMRAVAARAQACFAGTKGAAAVQLTVAPSGRVQKATVSGPLAGTPAGACVERVVKTATFPAWDGAPQGFDYEYARSE